MEHYSRKIWSKLGNKSKTNSGKREKFISAIKRIRKRKGDRNNKKGILSSIKMSIKIRFGKKIVENLEAEATAKRNGCTSRMKG